MLVYVINKDGKPLMPCSPARARKLMKTGQAKCIRRTPFTIKLLYQASDFTQEIVGGVDSGSNKIGCAVIIPESGKVIYQSEVQLRTDVSKKMTQRATYRRSRRVRKLRYRQCRFLNRGNSKRSGRLAPSIKSKVDSHLREIKFVESILPISKWKIELASFDIHKISNPEVFGEDYRNGVLKNFYNNKAYALHRDNYQCQHCKAKKVKVNVHHRTFRGKNGSDSYSNLITLCEQCHKDLHVGKFSIEGVKSKTKFATEIGIIKSQLKKLLPNAEETFGYETKFKREQILNLEKTHYNDAIAICCSDNTTNIVNDNAVYLKKHVSHGDYQQNKGKRSEIKIPTGKLFGIRKFDLIKTTKGVGFVKGKRTNGRFVIFNLNDITSQIEVYINKFHKRISARNTTLVEYKN